MISKNASMSSSRQSSKVLEDSLMLSLDSLYAASLLKERLEQTQRFPLAYNNCPQGTLTQRDQLKKQKKLNSSVNISHPFSEQRSKKSFLIIPTKPNKLSICRTVSLAYVSQQPIKSKLISHIRKQNTQQQYLQIKEQGLSYDQMGDNFTTVKRIAANCRSNRENQNRNKALIMANEELLKQISATEDLALTNDHIFAGLTKRLDQEHDKYEGLNRQILFLEEDRRRKQEKVAIEQRKNEFLVRQINDMKFKLKENLQDLKALKAKQYEQPTISTKGFFSLEFS